MTRHAHKHPEVPMHKTFTRSAIVPGTLLLASILLVSATAWATPPGMVGERNFERAVIALRGNNDAKTAQGHFQRAAEAFDQLMANNAKDGKQTRLSRLLMAGMSNYYAGHMQKTAKIMGAAAADNTAWEAPLYAGLALARMGKPAEAAAMWKRFPTGANQRMIGDALAAQIPVLESADATPQQAADTTDTVEAAILRQFSWNEHSVSQSSLSQQDQCHGRFWWRYAQSRCRDDILLRD